MFVELMPLLAGRTVLITVAKVDKNMVTGTALYWFSGGGGWAA